MRNTDPRFRSYENLDEQRRDNEKKQANINNRLIMKIIVIVITLFMILSSYPSLILGFFSISPVLAAVAWIVFIRSRNKRRQNGTDLHGTAFNNLNPKSAHKERNAQEYQTIAENGYDYDKILSGPDDISSSSYASRNKIIIDSWDIKDVKPPWEL